ncbi:MAG: right-handed parallel beta-helix repeat-containing protein [Phycisphaerae bacterium]|jgi:parallel beta-helix repeat protein
MNYSLIIAIVLFVNSAICLGYDVYVHPDGNDFTGDGSEGHPFQTIQKAVNHANEIDPCNITNILVQDGNESIDYESHQIDLVSNLNVTFEDGVVVYAASGFGNYEKLFRAIDKRNITMQAQGEGAVLKMRKDDYVTGEDRMVIQLDGCENVHIKNLTLKDSGGDGIYIGPAWSEIECKEIVIEDVYIDNNRRNGISVTAVNGLIIEDSIVASSNGTPPESGIDFEPERDYFEMKNVVVKNTIIENNEGIGLYFNYFHEPNGWNDPNFLFENIIVRNSKGVFVRSDVYDANGLTGEVKFKNVLVENNSQQGIQILKSKDHFNLVFENCVVCNTGKTELASIYFNKSDQISFLGGVQFTNCQVFDIYDRPAVKCLGGGILSDVNGVMYVQNDNRTGTYTDWSGCDTNNVNLVVEEGVKSNYKAVNEDTFIWYSTINSAVDNASNGDTIQVMPCIHYENVHFDGKSIAVNGTNLSDISIISNTVIDANNTGYTAVDFTAGEGANSKLSGITVQNAIDAGVFASNSSPTITNCIARHNQKHGFYLHDNSNAVLKECISKNNTKYGIYLNRVNTPLIEKCCLIDNNIGLSSYQSESVITTESYLVDNSTGIYIEGNLTSYYDISNSYIFSNIIGFMPNVDVNGLVQNCTFRNHTWQAIKNTGSGEPNIVNCLFKGNNDDIWNCGNISYSCTNDPDAGDDNIITSAPNLLNQAVSYWKLDEGSGTTVCDFYSNNDGAFEGDPCWVNGIFDGAVHFDGHDDYISVSNDPSLNFDSNDSFSVCLWFKSDPNEILGKDEGFDLITKQLIQYGAGYTIYLRHNRLLNFMVKDSFGVTSIVSSHNLTDDRWYFVCGVRDTIEDRLYMYIDGELIASEEDITSGSLTNPSIMTIGTGNSRSHLHDFLGYIDNIMIFRRALLPEEINNLYLYNVPDFCILHLSSASPCIDVGDPNQDYTGQIDTDGDDRIIDIDSKGDGNIDVDMGSDEYGIGFIE